MNDNGKRPLQKTDEDQEDEANKSLAFSSSTHPIDALEDTTSPIRITSGTSPVIKTCSHDNTTVTTTPEPVQELAILPPTPAIEDATAFWMALIEPNSELEYILAVAQMDPLNDPLGLVVSEVQQEVADFDFLDQFDCAREV